MMKHSPAICNRQSNRLGSYLFGACLLLTLWVLAPVNAAEPLVHEVVAGEKGYHASVIIANPTDKTLNNLRISIANVRGPIENVALSVTSIASIAASNNEPLRLSFDVSDAANDGDTATIKLQVSASDTHFDNPQPVVKLIISAADEAPVDPLADSTTTRDAGDSDDARKHDLYFVLRVEGSGYIPHWAAGSWHTSGYYETWFRLPYDESIDDALTAHIESRYSQTHPSCDSLDGWRVLGPRSTPIVWSTGPQITVMEKGPFTLADGPERTWITLEKSDWPRTDSKATVTDLRKAICG